MNNELLPSYGRLNDSNPRRSVANKGLSGDAMSWRDRLRAASFRGVPFYVQKAEAELGRRTVTHEFPGRDTPVVEDLGRRARRHRLEAFVVGPDYMARRDELLEAFELPGPGKLVHPYWGEATVAVSGSVRVRENTTEGGVARLSLDMVEAEGETALVVSPDTAAGLQAAADTASAAVVDDFAEDLPIVAMLFLSILSE